MLGKPNAGWAYLKIGNFTANVSSMTNVPCDLIKAFVDFINKGAGIASFDCEPYQFDLVLSYTMGAGVAGLVYIVDCEKKIFCENLKILDLAKEFIVDIKENIDSWASAWFGYKGDYSKIDPKYKREISTGINKLEKLIAQYEKQERVAR